MLKDASWTSTVDSPFWTATQPMTVDVNIRDDRLGATWRLRTLSRPPTAGLGAWSYAGLMHNLRSALDSCVWEMATRAGHQPARPHRIQFPIERDDPERWKSVVKDRLDGVPEVVADRVKLVQPFNRPEDEREQDALVLLQELSNLDKHRASVRALAVMHESSHNFAVRFADDEASSRNVPPDMTLHQPVVEDGSVLGELRTVDPIVSVSGTWGIGLRLVISTSIGDRLMFETLDDLVGYVNQVLAVVYAGATRDDQEATDRSEEPWLDYEPAVVRAVADEGAAPGPSEPSDNDGA